MTVLDLLTDALGDLGVVAAGETLEGDDAQKALRLLNALIDHDKLARASIYTVTRNTFSIISGTATYSIATRPVYLDGVAYFDANSLEIPLDSLGDATGYAQIVDKTLAGEPTHYYYNRTYPNGALTLWPVPNITVTGVRYDAAPVDEFASTSASISLPPGYRRYYRAMLALECAPAFEVRDVHPLIVQAARDGRIALSRTNPNPSLKLRTADDGMPGTCMGAWFDIRRGY